MIHETPALTPELQKRIRLVRRDIGNLCFHFTRGIPPTPDEVALAARLGMTPSGKSAYSILASILNSGHLRGTGTWSGGDPTVCFTEAPIEEFTRIFALVQIAASEGERPRYEPYGIAVPKTWLYQHGGRPAIYDHPEAIGRLPVDLRYRGVPYDPIKGVDYTWEREWRVAAERLELDPKSTLVVVPTADEAFDLAYEESEIEAEPEHEYGGGGIMATPRWLVVSLDLFGHTL